MMDREWKAGGRAFRRPGLALERSLCNWICKGIVQGDKHYLFTRNVSCRVVREAGTLRVVGLLRVGVLPAVAPACVDVEHVSGQETAVLETLGLQHRFEVLGGNQLPRVQGLTAADLRLRIEQHRGGYNRRRFSMPSFNSGELAVGFTSFCV